MGTAPCYVLGLDSSTQSLKATVIDEALNVVYERTVNFDAELPEFKTQGGVHRHADGVTVTSPAILWVAALDLLLAHMRSDGAPLGKIVAISGSGQQHGSVWLNARAAPALHALHYAMPLRTQLADVFSVGDSPIWMDSSTGAQCAALEKAMGGAQRVAELSGSRAYERFTGNQIAKIYQTEPGAYAATARISLVSSFVASLLIGSVAPIDAADGSGMNVMDLRRKQWDPSLLKATAPDLAAKLGMIVPSHTDIGLLHAYYMRRYGFNPACRVIAFSGDNPCSLAGLRLSGAGDVAISLGTSDTVFGTLTEPRPSAEEGHVFASPVDPAGYMALICRKNGSLTREHVRDQVADRSWETFNRLLAQTPPGNHGKLAIHVLEPEITPAIHQTGVFRFDAADGAVPAFTPAEEVRAVVENQFLSMRLHAENLGIKPTRLIATGGASVNTALLRVAADIFGTPVFVAEKSDSASLGAAYRALHGWRCREGGRVLPFAIVFANAVPFRRAVDPDAAAHGAYAGLLPRLARLEQRLVGG
ncbi:MAG: carbohydrate kinase [Lentisphaerae bacterium]|nr:carbohydrate kinase [Lentisphaerota bacterium]